MANFVLIDKKSLNEISVDTSNINLTAPSSVHTKLYRNEVSEFIQDGNNLILKLKNGKTIVVKNFFIVKGELESELVFEDTTGMPWLPYLLGGAAASGAIAALASDSDGGDNNTTTNTPPSVVAGKEKQPTITGENKPKTGNITDVKDPDGDQLTYKVTTDPKNGTVTIDPKTGAYIYTPNKGFNGDDTFTVTVDDGKGGTTTIEVPVSVIPAAEVEVTGYEDNVGNAPENIASGKSTNDNKPVISGIAKNAETVEVIITDAQGKVVKTLTVPVSKDGKWATPELPDALKDGDYTITAKAKDALGNEVASKEYTVTVDTTAPQVEVEVGIDGKITVTYPKDVDPSTVDPNTIEVTDKDGNKVPGITFTGPDADGTFTGQVPTGVDGDVTVKVPAGSYEDQSGNPGLEGKDTVTIPDTTPPQVEVEVGIDGKITVTYPKDVDPSTVDPNTIEVTDKDGNKVPGITFTGPDADGTFTGQVPTGVDGDVTVKVPAGSYEDQSGNPGLEGKDTVTIPDTTPPQVEVEVGIDGKITVTYPKDVDPSTVDPNTIEVTDKDGNKVPGITFTGPDADGTFTGQVPTGVDGDVTVKVPAGSYEDQSGNPGLEGKDTVTIPDTTPPQVEVEVGIDGKITVTYPKDVDPSTVDPNTIEVTDKDGNKVPGITFTGPDADGTFTGQVPTGVDGDVTVKVPAGSYEDQSGNPGLEGKDTVTIPDTTAPTVAVVVNADGTVDFIFSEEVTGFDASDITVANGTLSGLTQDPTDPTKWTANWTPAADFEGDVTVVVTDKSYTDLAGNEGSGNSGLIAVDTKAPTVDVVVNADGTVDFIFSEEVTDFDLRDIAVVNGDVNNLVKVPNSNTWTANWTPKEDFEGDVTVVVNDKSYTDLAGNEGSGNSGSITVDTKTPIEKVDELAVVEDEPHSSKIISKNLAGNLTYTLDPKNGPTHGKVIFDSNDPSKYTYIPDENYSGNDSFKVIVNDDKGGKTVIEVPVTIEAVADMPSVTESMEFNVGELTLNKYVWNNINGKITIGGKVYEFDGSKTGGNGSGNGINPTTLVEGINALLANKDKDGERKPAVEDQTTILKDPDVKAGSAVLINGLVYLEEGKTYTYKGQADDSGMIIIGNGLSSQYVSWAGPTGGQHSSVFTVEKTGFYDFNLYVHNETGKGNFDFKVTEENGADVKYYPSAEAIQKELPGFIQLGDKDTANGFYDMKFGYAGYADDETRKINLEKVNAKLIDIDGSETLTVTLSNVPAGTTLTVTSVDSEGNETKLTFVEDGTGKITIPSTDGIIEYKDFVLELAPDAKVGTETIKLEVTATEKSNGDSKSDSFDFELTVKDPATKPTNIEAANNGDDIIVGLDNMPNLLVGDQGGLQTNFVAGQDYNVAVVLDISTSMEATMGDNGATRIDVAKDGLKLFVEQMVNHNGAINFSLITFEYNSKNHGSFTVTKENLGDILSMIDNVELEGGTEPGVGFEEADKWFLAQQNGFENQTYYITDGDPYLAYAYEDPENPSNSVSEEEAAQLNEALWKKRDDQFASLAEKSKIFGVGLGEVNLDNVQRYDNTDVDGNKIEDWDPSKRGSSQVLYDQDALVSYLISGSNKFEPAEAGNDKVTGGNGNDILFGDAINTNHLQWDGRDSVKHPQYSGYSTLIDYLKATVTNGAEPTEKQVYDYVKEHYMDFVKADANDPNVKGGNDIIDGGAGNDIIIAGAGNDLVIASQGNDIISTGPGNDTLLYKLLSGFENENTGGHGVDTWVDFALGNPATNDNADVLKFSEDFFTGLKMEDLISSETIGKFITVDYDAASQTATISVDRDGEGSGYTNETLLHLTNQDTAITLDDLLANNQIVIG